MTNRIPFPNEVCNLLSSINLLGKKQKSSINLFDKIELFHKRAYIINFINIKKLDSEVVFEFLGHCILYVLSKFLIYTYIACINQYIIHTIYFIFNKLIYL